MRDQLQYPFDVASISRRRRALREELLASGGHTDVRVAILGGSTTADLQDFLELFLLSAGISPTFYVSDYGRFWEEAVLDSSRLREFDPEVVLVHTTNKNVRVWPRVLATDDEVYGLLAEESARFEMMWTRLLETTRAVIVQNNFDPLAQEPLGHVGATAPYGRTRFLAALNGRLAAFAEKHPRVRINDIHSLAAHAGLSAWSTAKHWMHYRMALTQEGSALCAHGAAKIVRAAFGKSKKCLVLDLDDTLWGGVIGEDGVSGLRLGEGHPEGEAFSQFHRYCRALRERGVLLAVCSKNDANVARSGFTRKESILKETDFSAFVANWEPKPDNLRQIARTLGIGIDALVFVDDNPREQELVRRELPEVSVVKATHVSEFADALDREGFFEPFTIGADDAVRAASYAANAERTALASRYDDYGEYLDSLEMTADIGPVVDADLDRVTQLVNKTNQWNLTTRRHTLAEVERIAHGDDWIALSGRLADKFGDSGLVSTIFARQRGDELSIELWIMSCRVLKRELELAMFDALVEQARRRGVRTIVGHYVPTPKNAMVSDLYPSLGFTRCQPDTRATGGEGDVSVFRLEVSQAAAPRSHHIRRLSDGRDPKTALAAVS
jgi:FkbH-like protein